MHDPADVRERAADLLSRPPFTDQQPGPVGRLLGRVGDVIADLLARLLTTIGGGSTLGWVIVALGTAALVAVVWRVTRGTTPDGAVPVVPSAGRTAAAWHAAADTAAARGDRREALRCRYAALVTSLVEAGLLDDVPGRTVRELDREVASAAPHLAAAVTAAGDRFERVVYGGAEATDDDLAVVGTAARRSAARAPTAVP
jgi:hypothetical protein